MFFNTLSIIVTVILIRDSFQLKNNKTIIQLETCRYQLSNGKVIDLKKLDNLANPKISSKTPWDYKYNPCTPFTCGTATTAALCQIYQPDPFTIFNLGDQSSIMYSYDNQNLLMKYQAVDKGTLRKVELKCVCSETTESFQFDSEDVLNVYYMTLTSKCCCPDGCANPKPSDNGGLSGGSVLIIIFFVLLTVYFVGGILFMKFSKKSTGIEMIPNSSFWLALPGNIKLSSFLKDGFSFVLGKIKNGSSYQNL